MTKQELDTLQQAAHGGNADAQYQLAMMHIYGDGVAEDNVLAAQLLEKAYAQGHVEAAYNLGVCYHYGHGVEADMKRACMLYWTSAQCGYGKGMVLMGRFYAEGIAVEQNAEEAVRWYRMATESGDPDAAADAYAALGRMAAQGCGMPADEAQARQYFRLADNVRMSQRYAQHAEACDDEV